MPEKSLTIKEAVAQSHLYRIRMFKSDFLESFSYVHPLVPFIIFIPVILFSGFSAFYFKHVSVLDFLKYAVLGVFFWTLVEYTLHRFLFHPPLINEFFKKVYFYTHGIHHDAMNDATRLVMPPAVSVPLATGVYFASDAIFGMNALPFFVGFVTSYIIYDFLHFATHFFIFKNSLFKILKKKHMLHHHKDHGSNFGFTSPLWDYVFRTNFRKKTYSDSEQTH